MKITKIKFNKRESYVGALVFIEGCKDIPFEIKRVYYIYHVGENLRRGFHAHKTLQQVIVCIHGSCKLLLDDGKERVDITLNDPSEGLLIDSTIWREMYGFSPGTVLMALASDYYNEQDYIRDYKSFIKYIGGR